MSWRFRDVRTLGLEGTCVNLLVTVAFSLKFQFSSRRLHRMRPALLAIGRSITMNLMTVP